jgi:hypothetical protein
MTSSTLPIPEPPHDASPELGMALVTLRAAIVQLKRRLVVAGVERRKKPRTRSPDDPRLPT